MIKKLLVCDLDNTLYDWVSYFVASFYAMIDETVRITGCDRERLLDDFGAVHRKYGDSEHPFSLLETATIKGMFPGEARADIAKRLDSAFYAFNSSRKENLRLYPGVGDALEALLQADVTLVAHTESNLFAVVDRLTRLGLSNKFKRIYCRERAKSQHPNPDTGRNWLRSFPLERTVELSHHQRKPNPDVLIEICSDEGVSLAEAAYVGDSMARDMLMAKEARVFSVWAKYGSSHQAGLYEKLVRITHWTSADVIREKELREKAKEIEPEYVLENSFDEILLPLLEGGPQLMGTNYTVR